jgi:hypothetical protein
MLHRQEFASRNMSEDLQTAFQAFIRLVKYVKKKSIEIKTAKLCDDLEAEHMALLSYCGTR